MIIMMMIRWSTGRSNAYAGRPTRARRSLYDIQEGFCRFSGRKGRSGILLVPNHCSPLLHIAEPWLEISLSPNGRLKRPSLWTVTHLGRLVMSALHHSCSWRSFHLSPSSSLAVEDCSSSIPSTGKGAMTVDLCSSLVRLKRPNELWSNCNHKSRHSNDTDYSAAKNWGWTLNQGSKSSSNFEGLIKIRRTSVWIYEKTCL